MTTYCGDAAVSEKEFMANVLSLARLSGWKTYHVFDSRRSAHGFPDLFLARPPRIVIAELKTEKGRLTPEQRAWLELVERCGVETYCWRPSDWPTIEATLKRPA